MIQCLLANEQRGEIDWGRVSLKIRNMEGPFLSNDPETGECRAVMTVTGAGK